MVFSPPWERARTRREAILPLRPLGAGTVTIGLIDRSFRRLRQDLTTGPCGLVIERWPLSRENFPDHLDNFVPWPIDRTARDDMSGPVSRAFGA